MRTSWCAGAQVQKGAPVGLPLDLEPGTSIIGRIFGAKQAARI